MEIYQWILICLAIIVLALYIYKRLSGKDILKNIVMARPIIAAIGGVAEAVYHMWPDKKEMWIVHTVVRAAINGAEVAEKAWKMGNLEKEQRNAYAKALVKDTLSQVGIVITPQVAMIIDGAIEAVCIMLPHETEI